MHLRVADKWCAKADVWVPQGQNAIMPTLSHMEKVRHMFKEKCFVVRTRKRGAEFSGEHIPVGGVPNSRDWLAKKYRFGKYRDYQNDQKDAYYKIWISPETGFLQLLQTNLYV